jgi:amidase
MMISLSDYTRFDATGLADLVARRQVKPEELIAAAFEAASKVNPKINAMLQTLPEQARAEINTGSRKSPFAGVPFVIKELVLHAKGVRSDSGSRLARGFVPDADTELMARFRRAGLVLIGTTQTPEFGYNPTTETVAFGPVHNPWNLDHSAGGSSGGSGASVAAGIVPVAHANDGGGSIRIPASCNGLVGLKPTRDRIPSGPDYADPLCGLAIEFALTRTVRDAAALLDAVAGPDIGAPGFCVTPVRPYLAEVGAPTGRMKIAWTTTPASGLKIDPECVKAVHETVKLLEGLGHELVEDRPPLDWELFLANVHRIWVAFNALSVDAAAMATGRKPGPDNLEAVTLACVEEARKMSASDLLTSIAHQNVVSRQVGVWFEKYDLHLSPTLARPPAPLGEINQNRSGCSPIEWTQQVFTYCPFTPLYNTTGQPAISLPLHWTDGGLPVGVQLVARFGDESSLIRIAAQLEEARPWSSRRPPVHAAA